ncbi:MAG: GIY-YIG nuclease family protein [Nonlabens sp.]
MAWMYIIFSDKLDRYYIGATNDEVEHRINKHNNGTYGSSHFTARACDWILKLAMECDDYPHAIRLERKIKSMKSRKYIANLLKYSEMRERIIKETSNT